MLPESELNIDLNGSKKIHKIDKKISFKNVSFGYENNNESILEKINIDLQKNLITGIKGPSGSGKSTFLDLLLGLYRPKKGEIFIDSENIKDLDLNFFRKKVSYISQEPFLINASIKKNLLIGVDRSVSDS